MEPFSFLEKNETKYIKALTSKVDQIQKDSKLRFSFHVAIRNPISICVTKIVKNKMRQNWNPVCSYFEVNSTLIPLSFVLKGGVDLFLFSKFISFPSTVRRLRGLSQVIVNKIMAEPITGGGCVMWWQFHGVLVVILAVK